MLSSQARSSIMLTAIWLCMLPICSWWFAIRTESWQEDKQNKVRGACLLHDRYPRQLHGLDPASKNKSPTCQCNKTLLQIIWYAYQVRGWPCTIWSRWFCRMSLDSNAIWQPCCLSPSSEAPSPRQTSSSSWDVLPLVSSRQPEKQWLLMPWP